MKRQSGSIGDFRKYPLAQGKNRGREIPTPELLEQLVGDGVTHQFCPIA
jgi:hypothetical protein